MAKTELKDLIIAYRSNGMAYTEIAEKLGISADYARTVFSRANRAERKSDVMKPDGYCKFCGNPLDTTGDRRNRLFCSRKCRNDYHNRRILHVPYICICESCGHEFVAYGNPTKRFCSRECQTLAGRKG